MIPRIMRMIQNVSGLISRKIVGSIVARSWCFVSISAMARFNDDTARHSREDFCIPIKKLQYRSEDK